jgi:hypothetical protein
MVREHLERALQYYQEGRERLYRESGLAKYEELGRLYAEIIKGYEGGQIGVEIASKILQFSSLIQAFYEHEIVGEPIRNFERELYEEEDFRSYVAINLASALIAAKLQLRTMEEAIEKVREQERIATEALRRLEEYGVKLTF